MIQRSMERNYKEPKFELVKTDERNKVFFAASGTPGAPGPVGSLNSMSNVNGAW